MKCYKCIYRRDIPGDYHSSCTYPFKDLVEININDYGSKRGWANWPFNFDPLWIESCNGFTIDRWEDEE